MCEKELFVGDNKETGVGFERLLVERRSELNQSRLLSHIRVHTCR